MFRSVSLLDALTLGRRCVGGIFAGKVAHKVGAGRGLGERLVFCSFGFLSEFIAER